MKRRIALIAGGLAVLGGAAYRAVLRRRAAPDPADELRRKLDESRAIVEEREQFESGETPVDRVDERRRGVHEQGRAAIDEMKNEPESQ